MELGIHRLHVGYSVSAGTAKLWEAVNENDTEMDSEIQSVVFENGR